MTKFVLANFTINDNLSLEIFVEAYCFIIYAKKKPKETNV